MSLSHRLGHSIAIRILFIILMLVCAFAAPAMSAPKAFADESPKGISMSNPVAISASGADVGGATSGFVARQGSTFLLGGQLFRFIGTNAYFAASYPAIYQCGPMAADQAQLDDWFARMKSEAGATVVRFWAHPPFLGFSDGGTALDTRGMDRVLLAARRAGVLVLPVLGDQWHYCDGYQKNDSWYSGGYRSPQHGQGVSYREAIRQVVSHYRDEPQIFAWELMNEPTATESVLIAFGTDMLALTHAADPNHLVSLGGYALDRDGWRAGGFARLNALPGNDFASYHDYHNEDSTPLPGEPGMAVAHIGLVAKDANWSYSWTAERTSKFGVWEEWTRTIPAGSLPFRELGLEVADGFAGTIYIDDVTINNAGDVFTYSFEDGDLSGFTAGEGGALTNTNQRAYSGKHALKLVTDGRGTKAIFNNARVPVQLQPGATMTWHVFIQNDGVPTKLAEALRVAREKLGLPIIVAEHGECVTPCAGLATWTPADRASNVDAKIQSFLAQGGAGYMPWAWMPDTYQATDYGANTDDPLLAVLQIHAQALALLAPPIPPPVPSSTATAPLAGSTPGASPGPVTPTTNTLGVADSVGGSVVVMPRAASYPAGTVVKLTAVGESGHLFTGWAINGLSVGFANPLTIRVARPSTVAAHFAPLPAFLDVSPDDPASAAIAQLAARGIIRGYGDGRFGLDDDTSRAQMAALIACAMGWENDNYGTSFSDPGMIDAALWRNVGTLAHHGVARGYGDGSYHPTEPVLRSQVISFIVRAMVAKGYWQPQPDDSRLFPNVPLASGHRGDLTTWGHYVGIFPEATPFTPW